MTHPEKLRKDRGRIVLTRTGLSSNNMDVLRIFSEDERIACIGEASGISFQTLGDELRDKEQWNRQD